MTESAVLLRVLQEGDSFFPSGTVSFSWGLETLCADGAICKGEDVKAFVLSQLRHRWASFDRPVIVAAALAGSIEGVADIDWLVEAQTLADEFRTGSRRIGNGLLAVHVKLATAGAGAYSNFVNEGRAIGHLAPMQGYLWSRRGIGPRDAALLSAHTMCIGLLGAAVRLGVIGHIDAQKILTATHGDIAALLELPIPDVDEIHTFVPQTEIGSMRHEVAQMRMFAN
jgi:urease accessory protein